MKHVEQTAEYWIEQLELSEHPEGGYFREVYRSHQVIDGACLPKQYGGRRSVSTSIYFLLKGCDISRLHRLRSDELWHFHAGSSATLHIIDPDGSYRQRRIGLAISNGELPQVLIPAGSWFGASVDDPHDYVLVGCTVAPGFDFDDFELAERDRLFAEFPQHQGLIERMTKPTA